MTIVSRYTHEPMSGHLETVYRMLRYLKGTSGKAMWHRKHGNFGVGTLMLEDQLHAIMYLL